MNVCRFRNKQGEARVGVQAGEFELIDLTAAGLADMQSLLESADPVAEITRLTAASSSRARLADVSLLPPVEGQEVWAAGVTYLRSKTARMEESDFSASAYDRVYAAERPELFFKSLPEKVVGAGDAVGIRRDATWNVPEPELALVINSKGKIVGYTVGNDMSSRDIEGENLLYLPQAKIYTGSCALGPWIRLGATEAEARQWQIKVEIQRDAQRFFAGETSVGQIKRTFEELVCFLFRSQKFPRGAVMLTGTGVVPPETFTLREADVITIEISGIGRLQNRVELV